MRYRIGDPSNDQWLGANPSRRFGVFEADTDQGAWEKGQKRLFQDWAGHTDRIVALEREELFPKPRLLSGDEITVHSIIDKNPRGFQCWVRVAVGIIGADWGDE